MVITHECEEELMHLLDTENLGKQKETREGSRSLVSRMMSAQVKILVNIFFKALNPGNTKNT